MAITPDDPRNLRELAKTFALGVRIVRREAKGKSTKRLEARADRILADAQKRETDRRKK